MVPHPYQQTDGPRVGHLASYNTKNVARKLVLKETQLIVDFWTEFGETRTHTDCR